MFTFKHWRQDLRASLTVYLIALPLCLGIALASGTSIASGFIPGIIGGIFVGLLTDSSVSVSGPAAALAVVVMSSLLSLGSFEGFALAVFISGGIQALLGILRLGSFADFFPAAVVKGMLAALGLIVILNQIPAALLSWPISLSTLVVIILWEKITPKTSLSHLPGPFLAIVVAALIARFLDSDPSIYVQVPFLGPSDFFSHLTTPDWEQWKNPAVYLWAFTFSLIGSLLSVMSIETADRLSPGNHLANKNRELLVQGGANLLSGLWGGLPVTAVYVRTSANYEAGGRTNLSTIFHGLWLFVSVAFVSKFFNLIPIPALAIVLIVVGYKLNRPSLYRSSYAHGATQFFPFISTIAAILFLGPLVGIAVGLLIGIIFIVRSNLQKCMTLVSEDENYLLRFYKDVSFVHKNELKRLLDEVPAGSYLIIDRIPGVHLDQDIEEVIEDFSERASHRRISVELSRFRR